MVGCDECNEAASAYLAYSNSSMCKDHFFHHFEKRVKRTIRQFSMLKGAKHVGLALSGGKDSTVLLTLLKPMCDEMRIELTAIAVDEGIGGYREKLLQHARSMCKQLDVNLVERSYAGEIGLSMDDVMTSEKRKGTSFSYCGVFRRWALNRASRELGIDRLATGHNLDDLAQTVIMNLIRNEPARLQQAHPASLEADDESMVPRIRPLATTPEREVALYAMLKEMDQPRDDCPYAHEALRNEVRDFLNSSEENHPGTKLRVLRSYLSIHPALASMPRPLRMLTNCELCGEPSSTGICKRCELRGHFIRHGRKASAENHS